MRSDTASEIQEPAIVAAGPAQGADEVSRPGRRLLLRRATGLGLAHPLGGLLGARDASASKQKTVSHPLVGSWRVTVSYADQPAATLTNLITYTADGGVLAASTSQLPAVPGAAGTGLTVTEGHGAWAATGARSADATFV